MVLLFCEVYTRDILPALRALIAKELTTKYGMTQWSAAKALGITQPLINYYLSGKRGSKLINALALSEDVMRYVRDLAELIIRGSFSNDLFCKICINLRSKKEVLRGLGIDDKSYAYPICVMNP